MLKSKVNPVFQAETSKGIYEDVRKESNKPLGRQVLEVIKDTAERSSIHGFPSFVSNSVHWFVKLIWLVCVGASWGYLIFQINNSLSLYSSFSVVSSSSIAYEAPTDFFGKSISKISFGILLSTFFSFTSCFKLWIYAI